MFLWLRRLLKKKEKSVEEVIDYVHQTEIPLLIEELIIKAVTYGEKQYLGRYFQEDRDDLYNVENKIRQILCRLYRSSPLIEKIDEHLRYKIRECFFYYGYNHGYLNPKTHFINCPDGDAAVKKLYGSVNEFISRLCRLEPNWKDLLEDDDNIYCIRNGLVVLEGDPYFGDSNPKDKNKGPVRKVRKKVTRRKSG